MSPNHILLGTFDSEGFTCNVFRDGARVYWQADADIDADGANGQHGALPAYRADNKGSELLANGGMAIWGGKVVCAHSWAKDIVITGPGGQPKVFPGGIIASKTALRLPGPANDPASYVDSETVPYIVVNSLLIKSHPGIVMGCRARASYKGKSVDCVVADLGPRKKIGELSIQAARSLGIPSSPRSGGIDGAHVLYEMWPGEKATLKGVTYPLQKA